MTVAEAKELFTRLTEEGMGDYDITYEYFQESCQPKDINISHGRKEVDIS